MFWLVRMIAGHRVVRVPFEQIENIASAVHLKGTAESLKLHQVEDEVRAWIPRRGAL
jgi:murein tripeptide amidase MpaA